MLSFASATDCDLVVNYLTSCAARVTASVMATTGLKYNDVQPEDEASRVLLSGWVIQYSPNQPPRYGPDGSTGRKFVLGYADVTYPAFDFANRLPNDMDATLRVFSDMTKEHRVSHVLLPRVSDKGDGPRCRLRGPLLFPRGGNASVLRFPSEEHARLWAAAIDVVVAVPPLDQLLSSKEMRKNSLKEFKQKKAHLSKEVISLKDSACQAATALQDGILLMDVLDEPFPSRKHSTVDGSNRASLSSSTMLPPSGGRSSTILTYKPQREVLPGTVIISGSNTVTTAASSGTVLVHDPSSAADLKREMLGTVIEGPKENWNLGDFGGNILAQTKEDTVRFLCPQEFPSGVDDIMLLTSIR
ncbi:hypothetical protein FOZ61_010767 [Perkinsus olseni]|nr:hypothetical protein FOZ61_010767 [Perkinsus olseni]